MYRVKELLTLKGIRFTVQDKLTHELRSYRFKNKDQAEYLAEKLNSFHGSTY